MTAVEVEPGRYDCPACEDRFESLSDKKRHLREEHADTRPVRRARR